MPEIVGQRMSNYTPLDELTPAEQETYLANAAVTTYGKTSVGGENTNVNVPLSAIGALPTTSGKSSGDVLTFNGTGVDWATPSGGGLTPVAVAATSSSGEFTIEVPSNHVYVEVSGLSSETDSIINVTLPTVATGDMLHVVLSIPGIGPGDYTIRPSDDSLHLMSISDNVIHGKKYSEIEFRGKGYAIYNSYVPTSY